jgi:hypothetical protein
LFKAESFSTRRVVSGCIANILPRALVPIRRNRCHPVQQRRGTPQRSFVSDGFVASADGLTSQTESLSFFRLRGVWADLMASSSVPM